MDNYDNNIALLYGAAAVVLTVFYVSLRKGWSHKWKAARKGGYLASSGIFIAMMVFWAAKDNIWAPGAAAGILLIMLAGFVMFIAGLGLYLGGAAAHQGRLVKLSATAIPLLVVGAGVATAHIALEQERAELRAARAVFWSETVHGTFAGHPVAIPVAPQYSITHECASRPVPFCRSLFLTATSLNDASQDDLEIFSLDALHRPDDVRQEIVDWCEERGAVQDTIWCAEMPDYNLSLLLSENVATLEETNGWVPVEGISETARLACRQYHSGPTCRLIFVVADGVMAEATFFGLPRNSVVSAEQMVRARAGRLWQAMSEI